MMCTLILGFAALNAAATASDAGYWVRPWDLRRIYIIRWIDWLVSSLLMCWILTWLCGSAGTGERLHLMVLDALMIFMGFMATVVEGTMKWVFFLFAFLFYIWVAQKLCRMNGASPGGLKVAKGLIFTITKFLILVLWFFYPLIWLMAPGLNHWCASSEATMFGILDFVLKVKFSSAFSHPYPLPLPVFYSCFFGFSLVGFLRDHHNVKTFLHGRLRRASTLEVDSVRVC